MNQGGIWKKSAIEGKHKLSGKDVKKLRQSLLEQGNATEEEIGTIVPSKAPMTLLKLSNKAHVYMLDGGNPVAFDPEGRGELYPSLYVLWRLPHMLKPLYTHSEVTPKVLSGADLMMPGVIEPAGGIGEFSSGEHMCVCIPSNPYPLAVGKMEQSSASIAQSGFKGKGLRVWHFFADPLWALGDKSKPDRSFRPDRIYPPGEGGGDDETSAEEAAAADEMGIQGASEGIGSISVSAESSKKQSDHSAPTNGTREQNDESKLAPNNGDGTMEVAEGAVDTAAPVYGANAKRSASSEEQRDETAFDTSTPGGMDQALDYFFGKALAERISDNDLPIQVEKFYSQHLLQSRPESLTLDVKKSNYKKLPKLVKAMEKKGVITQKQVHKQDCIYSVNWQSQHLQGFDTNASAQKSVGGTKERGRGGSKDSGGQQQGQSQQPQAHVSVHPMYKVASNLKFVFGENATQNRDRLFSETDVENAIRKYCEANDLLDGEGSARLDDALAKALFGKKEEVEEGSVLSINELYRRMTERLQLHNRILVTREGQTEEIVRKGKLRYINIQTEDRHTGRKFITRMTGLEYYAIDPKEFSGIVQRTFNTTASVQKLPGARSSDACLQSCYYI